MIKSLLKKLLPITIIIILLGSVYLLFNNGKQGKMAIEDPAVNNFVNSIMKKYPEVKKIKVYTWHLHLIFEYSVKNDVEDSAIKEIINKNVELIGTSNYLSNIVETQKLDRIDMTIRNDHFNWLYSLRRVDNFKKLIINKFNIN